MAYEGRGELFAESKGRTDERAVDGYYALSEREYEKILECLKKIGQGVRE